MNCALCQHNNCYTQGQNCTAYKIEQIDSIYNENDKQIMAAAAATESRNYLQMTRLEESVYFAKELGAKKIGIAFCIGLRNEARFCVQYFKAQGLSVESVCCKICSFDKGALDLEKIKPNQPEAMCNPKIQAKVLNTANTDLNFIVGLCVGHDMLFTKESNAPVSCLITKDRVLANNPAGAVYSRYWRRKLGILEEGTV